MRIPFVGPSYTARSSLADTQRTVNAYLEMDNSSPRAPVALYGRPGLVLADTLGDGPIRGMLTFQDYGMVVTGNKVYSVIYNGASSYTTALLGTIGTSSGNVGMAFNGTEVIIVDGVAGWLADLATLTQITDVDFPDGVTQAMAIDAYFLVCGDGTPQFYINETAGSGSAWNALDYGSAEGSPDNTVACVANHREGWFFGAHSAEVFFNSGNADFPFERNDSAYMDVGTCAAYSVKALDNTVMWLGRDKDGQGIVYKAQGYNPVRVSTHAVEKAFQGYSTITDATAFTFQLEGHSFYVLSFPTANTTWAYDAATGQWYEWPGRNPSTGAEVRWRPQHHAFIGGKSHVGDWENGKVYRLDPDTYTDNSDPIKRLRIAQGVNEEMKRLFVSSMQVDMEVGTGTGTLSMRYSKNGGKTWSTARTVSLTNGTYDTRAIWRRLGSGRDYVFEISTTDAIKWAILGAKAEVEAGTS